MPRQNPRKHKQSMNTKEYYKLRSKKRKLSELAKLVISRYGKVIQALGNI